MVETFETLFEAMETFFEQYQFTKDFVIACSGVIFGGVVTVLINKGAIRKQAYFDLQYKTLNELIDQVYELEKSIESLEISLSFGDSKTAPHENKIGIVEDKALALNRVFREKRIIIHKYLTGVMLEKSAYIPAKLYGVIYDKEKSTLSNPALKDIVSVADIEILREVTSYTRNLKNQMIDSLEKLIFPSILSKLSRQLKKAKIAIGNIYGMWKVQCAEHKKLKRR